MLNLFLALVVNSFSHEDTAVSQPGEKVFLRMLRSAVSVSFSVVNVLKRTQVHPTDEKDIPSLAENKENATGTISNVIGF